MESTLKAGRKGLMLVLSAPSGTGKTTVCRKLRSAYQDVAVSISYTTREPRRRERDGVEYHFVDHATFGRMIAEGNFLEWAEVHGKRYGSSRADTERLIATGKDVLFDIDVQGGRQIKRSCPDVILVFLLPPSIEELMFRLRKRGTETQPEIRRRLQTAVWELEQGADYDHHVVNERIEAAVLAVDQIRKGILSASRCEMDLLHSLKRDAEKLLRLDGLF